MLAREQNRQGGSQNNQCLGPTLQKSICDTNTTYHSTELKDLTSHMRYTNQQLLRHANSLCGKWTLKAKNNGWPAISWQSFNEKPSKQ